MSVILDIEIMKLRVSELRRARDHDRTPESLEEWVEVRGGQVEVLPETTGLRGKRARIVLPDADIAFEFKLRWV